MAERLAARCLLLGTGVWLRPGNPAGLLAAQRVWTCAVAALMARGGLPHPAAQKASPKRTGR